MNPTDMPQSNTEPIHIWNHEVTTDEIDRQGHVNNVEYIRWMQEAAISHSRARGWPPARYEELGLGWVVHNHEITYLKPAREQETILVRTWVATLQRVTSVRHYRIERPADGKLLARARTDWAFINLATGTPHRIPPELASAFVVLNVLPADLPPASDS